MINKEKIKLIKLKNRKPKYSLTDCVELNKLYPETFHIPSEEEINSLKIGDIVKLIFNNKERMWVIIKEINNNNFIGTLDNMPFMLRTVKYKDIINFNKNNICQIN